MEQTKSRGKTPAARILSLALALCMIAAFVPAFTLTVGAASAEDFTIDTLVSVATTVFDGSYETNPASGDTPVANIYDGWSMINSGYGANVRNYTDNGVTMNYLQTYEDSGNLNGYYTADYSMDGYDYMILEFAARSPEVEFGEYGFFDTDGAAITAVRVGYADSNAIAPCYTFGSAWKTLSLAGTPTSTSGTGLVASFVGQGKKARVLITNDEDADTHTVVWYTNINGSYEQFYTETYDGTVNGLGQIQAYRIYNYTYSWSHMGLGDFMVYMGTYPESTETVTIKYTAGDETIEDSYTYDPDSVSGYTFPEFYYCPDGTNTLYYAAETTVSNGETAEVTMDVKDPIDVSGYYNGKNLRYDANGDGTDEGYVISSDNLIPNGDFTYGLNGWYDGNGNAASESSWTLGDNCVTLQNVTQANAGALRRSWTITPGKTYLYTYYTSEGGNWAHQTSLQTALQQGESSSNLLIGTSYDGSYYGSVAALDATGQNTFVFTVDADSSYTYLQAGFRWCAQTFTNFGLYELTQDDSVLATTTIEYVDGNGNELQESQTIEGVIGDVIDLTDTDIVPNTISYSSNVYSYASAEVDSTAVEGTSYTVAASETTITLTYETDAVTSVTAATATVISGTTPVLPTSLSATTGQGNATTVSGIEWTINEDDITNDGDEATNVTIYGSADGITDGLITASVKVYPLTYTLDDITCPANVSGVAAYAELLQAASGELVIEFEYTPNGVQNNWIYISNGQNLWGAGAIGFGTSDTTAGSFNTQSSGTVLGYVTTGTTYHMLVETTVSDHTYTLTMASDGDNIWSNTDSYRASSDSLDTIVVSTNGASTSFTLTNIKVYDPNCTVETYTVKYVDPDGTQIATSTTYTTTEDNLKAYNDEITAPYVTIPTISNYIFTSKSVSGTTITLTYTSVDAVDAASYNSGYFFADVDDDTTFVSLNMLGAHDAFTAGMDSSNVRYDAAAIQQGGTSSTSYLALIGTASTVVNYSKSQDKTALELLEAGVRYFDIRLSRSTEDYEYSGIFGIGANTAYNTNGVFYTTHGILGDEFRPIAYTIGQWLANHPGEVVVLDFQEAYDGGDATSTTYADIASILDEAGITAFAPYNGIDGSSDKLSIKSVTYGGLTDDGTTAGVVMFARQVGYTQGQFYPRALAGIYDDNASDGDGWEAGKLYSYYDEDAIGSSFDVDYIQTQVDNLDSYNDVDDPTGDHAAYHYARVMQAQSESSNLINTASTDNSSLYSALTSGDHPDWLSALPIVMVNGVGYNTDDIATLLQGCNVAQTVEISYVDTDGNTVATTEKSLMVGTIFTDETQYLIVHDDTNGNYYVTNAYTLKPYTCTTGDGTTAYIDGTTVLYDITYVPSNQALSIPVTEIGDMFSTRPSTVGDDSTQNLYYSGEFNAYSWYDWLADDTASRDRIGFATIPLPEDELDDLSLYQLTGTIVNNNFNTNYDVATYIYAISVEAFNELDITTNASILTALDETKIAYAWEVENNQGTVDTSSVYLDSDVIKAAADDSGEVVLIGVSSRGLFGYSDMTISVVGKSLGVTVLDGAQIRVGNGVGTDETDTDTYNKITTGSGIRFIATVDAENTLVADTTNCTEFGIAIYDGGTGENPNYPNESTSDDDLKKIKAENYQDGDTHKLFTVAITDIASSNYNHIYVAVPYVCFNGNYIYDFDNAVARTPYQVAAGVLTSNSTDSTIGDTTYTYAVEDTTALYAALNAYANMTGARIEFTDKSDYSQGVVITTYANGATAHFKITSADYDSEGNYVIVLTADGNETMFYTYAEDTYRVNNSHSSFESSTSADAEVSEDGTTLTITIPAATAGTETE